MAKCALRGAFFCMTKLPNVIHLPILPSNFDSEQLCCSINFLTKKIDRYVIESVPKS